MVWRVTDDAVEDSFQSRIKSLRLLEIVEHELGENAEPLIILQQRQSGGLDRLLQLFAQVSIEGLREDGW